MGGNPDLPDLEEIEQLAALGRELLERALSPEGGKDDVESAGVTLDRALDLMPPEYPGRLGTVVLLALQRATHYGLFQGESTHRDAALSSAAAALASPDVDSANASTCHFVIAWMSLTSRLTGAQRDVVRITPALDAARRNGAAALLAETGTLDIAPEDAETAICHLRQITPTDAGRQQQDHLVPVFWCLALFALARVGRAPGDIARVADDLLLAAGRTGSRTPDHAELLTMRAALLAIQAESTGSPEERKSSAAALRDAATRLPEGHPARTAMLTGLEGTLRQQAAATESADDPAAEAEWIVETLERMPPDAPDYGRTLTSVAMRMLVLQLSSRNAVSVDRVISSLERALELLPPDDLTRTLAEFIYWGAIGTRAAMEHRPDVADDVITHLVSCDAALPAGHVFRPMAATGIASGLADQYAMTGELRYIEQARTYLQEAFDRVEAEGILVGTERAYGHMLHLRGLFGVILTRYEAAPGVPAAAVDDLEQAADLVGSGDPLYPRIIGTLEAARALRGITTAQSDASVPFGDSEREAFDQVLANAGSLNRNHPDFPALAAGAASGLVLRAVAERDTSLIGRAVSMFAEACAVPGLTDRERPRLLNLHGLALLTRYQLTGVPADLSNAFNRLDEARRAIGQETGSPHAGDVLESLARAYRYRADADRASSGGNGAPGHASREAANVDRAVTTGLASLREHAGDVLLQDSDENALAVARRSAGDATEMARWFLHRGLPEPAIAALELGRAMVLHAATTGAGVEEVLRDAGRAGLAGEWAHAVSTRAEARTVAGDLRYRIMTAIEGSSAEARLFAPPSLTEIAGALTACDADALVYLLPRGDDGIGIAILVDPDGQVRHLPLPGLYAGARSPAGAALRARHEADAAATDPSSDQTRRATAANSWLKALGELCDWAWLTAIGPVLDAVPARADGRERRLVLIPGGEFGLVAWHAARRRDGDGYRYACQEAVFSYTPSARQLTDLARRRPRVWADDPVLISDSAVSLYVTAMGIRHLYTQHYTAGSVFGYAHTRLAPALPGSAAATPASVLGALPHDTYRGASLLHFGCHARTSVPVMASRLELGQGGAVAVRDILRQGRIWRASRPPADSGGLVVLASCLSDVTEADFDEALTLATAFVSAGATGVVAARWRVPDASTALFMTIFHHYLNSAHPDPARALRAAQLWMLNPSRIVPDGVPAVLRDEARGAAPAEPEAWAAFAYQGR